MKLRITCPHCVGTGNPTASCSWCRGFGEMVKAERVCTDCLPSETDCPSCGGSHRKVIIYPACSRFELELLPSETYLEEN